MFGSQSTLPPTPLTVNETDQEDEDKEPSIANLTDDVPELRRGRGVFELNTLGLRSPTPQTVSDHRRRDPSVTLVVSRSLGK